jgi:hypothetical protein
VISNCFTDVIFSFFTIGDPVKMARVNIDHRLPRRLQIEQLFQNLIALLPCLSVRSKDSTA